VSLNDHNDGEADHDADPNKSPEAIICDKIHAAIAERRLTPGSRLVEEQLCEVFGASRARIRSVLQTLARDKLVTLHRNRGASVAYPSVQEAREVFAARRLIEVALAREVIGAIDDKGLKRLKAHLRKEALAEKSHDRALELRTSHEFHTLLAEMLGNAVILGFVRELTARSSLITAVYERPDANVCSQTSHGQLIALIEAGDAEGLAGAMLEHLNEIEGHLMLFERKEVPVDLRQIFAP
jgi:DNA-binding GntR family transcriptional regulator